MTSFYSSVRILVGILTLEHKEATIQTITNTELAILGLVAEQPKHGYQVEQEIEARGMREWTEIGFSSIYYVLNKLESAGWLESEQGPARKVYRLTAAGWAGYQAGVRERLAHPRPRSGDFDLALANLPAIPPAEARAALETYRVFLRERLTQVRAKWAQDRAGSEQAGQPFPPHVDALFDHSITAIEAEILWAEKYLGAEVPGHLYTKALGHLGT